MLNGKSKIHYSGHKMKQRNTYETKQIKEKGIQISTKFVVVSLFALHMLCKKSNGEQCVSMRCWGDFISIDFPFRIKDHQPDSCGSPGFDIHCDSIKGNTILELPSAGSFIVGYISYTSREIKLDDPENCLPKKLTALDLTKISPFHAQGLQYANFSLYNCSGADYKYPNYDIINCLSGSDYTIISTATHTDIHNSECRLWKNVSATGYSYTQLSLYSSIYLSWDVPPCNFDWCPSSLPQSTPPPSYTSYGSNYEGGPTIPTTVIVVFLFPVVIILLVCCIGVICCHKQRQRSQPAADSSTTTTAGNSTVITTTATVITGLDQNIIDLYPVMVIGESGRLITPDDATCPICLSNYAPHELLKLLPECLHRFHADCIDEWLRAKATCPICRISPPRSTTANL